jgi:LPXTG-motif cell wall-anchored protein
VCVRALRIHVKQKDERMAHPTTGKRFVALSAAVALGFGGAMIAGPASAAPAGDLKAVAAEAFTSSDKIAAIGHGADGTLVVQVEAPADVTSVEDIEDTEVQEALEPAQALAEDITGEDLVVQPVGDTYSTPPLPSENKAGPTWEGGAPDDVVAGAGYVVAGAQGYGLCSVGFPATDADGNDAIITAGHCSEEGNDVYVERPSTSNVVTGTYDTASWDESRKLGTFTHSQYGPAVLGDVQDESDLDPAQMQDFAVITVDESAGFNLIGEAATWSDASAEGDDLASDTTPITGVHDVTTDDIGSEVFHSGRTTGKTSGDVGWDESYGNVSIGGIVDGYAPVSDDAGNQYMVYGFASETPVGGGDSGGTVMMGDKAVGVVSGGIDADALEPGSPAMLWTAELSEGLTHLPGDYEIKTTEGSEEPTEEPSETPTPTPTETETSSPTPTETDDADVDPALAVDPQEIAAERFIAEDEDQAIEDDRGVTYTVTDVEPGSEVTFDTYAGGDDAANAGSGAAQPAADAADEPAKSITVTADEDGVASSRVWGRPTADASAYIGDYSVVATTETETLEGSFSVVEGSGDGDGGQDDGDNGDGDDLPRTGSTTAPLVAGAAGLVALGGALVYVARRRQA